MTPLENDLARVIPLRDSYLSIGVFDGVHLGHRYLLEVLLSEAAVAECAAGVVTFRNNPVAVLRPEISIQSLTTLEERTRLLGGFGIDLVVPITFTLEVSGVTAREFVAGLQRYLHMRGLVVGPDFALGHNRQGTPAVLEALGKELGFSVKVVDTYMQGDVRVSSSAIRVALTQGDVIMASRLLGKYYSLTGKVVPGAGRGGSMLGYPTANLAVDAGILLPADGIYATWAYIDQHRYLAATSIGVRPTFGAGERTIEAFVMDFHGDLYHKGIRLEFVERLRDEVPFHNIDALRKQMDMDVEQVRAILSMAT